jgi:thiamine biosynthesis lipoprotein
MTDPANPDHVLHQLLLQDFALSGSGIRKGAHIVDPRTARPVTTRPAVWVAASTAAATDAYSTACMVMTRAEIEKFQREQPGVWILVLEGETPTREDQALTFGTLPSPAHLGR